MSFRENENESKRGQHAEDKRDLFKCNIFNLPETQTLKEPWLMAYCNEVEREPVTVFWQLTDGFGRCSPTVQ